ncbi:Unannotated [Lentimonas sp. CC19]|nr:Unannotated [Lentimonas sp. CC19]CAA6697784.1 Unannotated [Lentimonas sp. CC10]CAA7072483.1 Unannotated [Lentimonas sp. CC11]
MKIRYALLLALISFLIGRSSVNKEYVIDEIKMRNGTLSHKRIIESKTLIPSPFKLDASVIEYRPLNSLPVQIYKTHRQFQESYPVARNIREEGNRIVWEDGMNQYKLEIASIPEEGQNQSQ